MLNVLQPNKGYKLNDLFLFNIVSNDTFFNVNVDKCDITNLSKYL
jgi:hypothetical protein